MLNGLLMPLFTEYVPDVRVRYAIGWAQISLIGLVVVYCMG